MTLDYLMRTHAKVISDRQGPCGRSVLLHTSDPYSTAVEIAEFLGTEPIDEGDGETPRWAIRLSGLVIEVENVPGTKEL